MAAFIARHDRLRAVVRGALAPVVGLSYLALHTNVILKSLILMLVFLGLGFLVTLRGRRK